MILYAAADLIWASKIKATADALGINTRPVRSPEMLDARFADSNPTALLVDLDKGEDALALIRHAREKSPAIWIIAWGPHVETALLSAARMAGADDVLTRGAMEKRLVELLSCTQVVIDPTRERDGRGTAP
jgi:DNA-binding response OmpR family regulator